MSVPPNEVFQFGAFELDATARVLLRDGAVVSLAPKAIDTLVVLVRHEGRIVDRDQLIRAVWPDTFVEEGGLTRNISVLRKVLEDGIAGPVIETVPKRGYRFVVPVALVGFPSSESAVDAPAAVLLSAPEVLTAPERRWPWAVAVFALVLMTGYMVTNRQSAARVAPSAVSIAVLPFMPATDTEEGRLLGAMMADALVSRLTTEHSIEARSSRATMNFGGPNRDAAAIGRDLRVEHVITGQVRRDARGVGVSAQLVSVADGGTAWSQDFAPDGGDLHSLHDRVAEAVSRALGRPLTSHWRRPRSAEAYEAYLVGRHQWNRRTRDALEAATSHFGQALDADPTYAAAYAGLADTYALLGVYGGIEPADAFARARAAATRAIDLDATLGEAYASLGFIQFAFDWDWAAADASFRRAIALTPNYATAHHWHGILLMVQGRPDDALRAIGRAEELDPLSPSIANDLGEILYMAGRFDEGIARITAQRRLHPNEERIRAGLGLMLFANQQPHEAIAELERLTELSDAKLSTLVKAYAAAGDRAKAETVLARGLQQAAGKGRHFDRFQHALALLGLGRADEAFDELEEAYRQRLISLTWLKVAPDFKPWKNHPRYRDLLDRMRLAD